MAIRDGLVLSDFVHSLQLENILLGDEGLVILGMFTTEIQQTRLEY